MTEKALRIVGLTRKYKRDAGIFDVTFDAERGEIIGICGGEQSGKTTLLRIIAGSCAADRGQASVRGYDALAEHTLAVSLIGTVIEEPTFYDYMTAEQNMRAVARLYRGISRERIDEIFEMMGLELCKKEKPRDFLPSTRMKFAIGLALLSNPDVVLLDEPFKALSRGDGEILKETMLEMSRDYGTTFVVTSRDAGELSDFCDKIGVMENGYLAAFDIPKNILVRELEQGEKLFEQSVREEKAVTDR